VAELTDAIQELMDQAGQLEEGPAKVALLEEACRLADVHGDLDVGFYVRKELVKASMMAGQPDVMLVAFSWCLAQLDRDPERFDQQDLLWEYKWILAEAPLFPQVNRRQIEDMLADMQRRYEQVGSSLHAVHLLRRDIAQDMGDRKAARAAEAVLKKTRRD
jgi:hypothetical protein